MRSFFLGESGAVTVDWTVMTAAVVGLGLASAGAVQVGTGNLGNAIRDSLSGAGVASLRWAYARDLVSQNFADGDFTGWSVARHGTFGAWGDMLGPFGMDTLNNPLTYDVSLPEGITNGLISFDLIIADSWDGHSNATRNANGWTNNLGDSLRFIVDGQVVTTEHFLGGNSNSNYLQDRQGTIQIGESTFNVAMTLRDAPAGNVGGSHWADQRWSVQIEALNAPADFQLGFSSTVNQGLADEAFGIQNFNISGN
jgi:hypothetical protein